MKMNCRRIEELIPLFVEGDLERGAAERVTLHLQSCGACGKLAADFRESQNWLRSSEASAFSEAELEDLKRGVLGEIQRMNGQASLFRRFADRWTYRQMIAATAAILILCAALAIYVYDGRGGRVIDSSGEVAEDVPVPDNNLPDVSPQPESADKAAGAGLKVRSRNRSTGATKNIRRKVRPAQPRLPVFASQRERPQRIETRDVQGEENESPKMLRIEIQTADPNIRIIWFAPKETDTNQSRPMTD